MKTENYKKYFDLNKIIAKIQRYLPNLDKKRLISAYEFAEQAHKGQYRKDGTSPYISHPVAAMEILVDLHADEDTLISCLLHDVPEDTKYEIHDVKAKFGDKVAFLVDGITKLSKVHYKQNMPERQVESLKKLLLHSAEDLRVIIVKLADRLHNMSTLGNIQKEEKVIRIATETLEIYVPIANLLGIREIKSKLEDYCFKYLFPSEYAKVKEKLKEEKERRKKHAEEFRTLIAKACKKDNLKVKIVEREKNIYSLYKKICADGKTIEDVDNRIAMSIIAEDVPSCYQVLGIIHSKFLPKTDRFKDYIASPKSNGYQSLHTGVFGVEGVLTEVQIKTERMDIEAEYGIASHFFLDTDVSDYFAADSNQSNWVNKILEFEKSDAGSDSFLEGLKSDIFQDRIFAFTPKGEPIDLPQGATAIDFAYAIHTEIGNKAKRAKINGKTRPISTILDTRDVVEIETSNQIQPSLSWLSFAKTTLARNRILDHLKKAGQKNQLIEGKHILQRELDISGLGLVRDINFRKLKEKIIKKMGVNFKTFKDLLISIGSGELRPHMVVSLIQGSSYSSADSGLRVVIKIMAKNRFGLLKDISDVLYRNVKDMYVLKGWASKQEKMAYFTADVLVDDVNVVGLLFDELLQIEDVVEVCRVSKKGLFLFYLALTTAAALWAFHPIALSHLSNPEESMLSDFWSKTLIYLVFLTLFLVFFWIQGIVSKYFPMFRQKSRKLIWTLAFFVPLLGIATLAIEIANLELELSLGIFVFEVLLIYGFLLMSYRNYRKSMAMIEYDK